MPPHVSCSRSPRPLLRTFCPSRLAADALAQSYERLFPPARRPLPQAPPNASRPLPRPHRIAFG
jgi:hypothetical protein